MADRSDRELTLVADTDMIDIIKTIRFLASHLQLPEAFSLKTGRLQTGNDHWSHATGVFRRGGIFDLR